MAGFLAGNRRGAMSELVQTLPFRGRRSRNKVSVGEPAEGSLTQISKNRESKSWSKAFEVSQEISSSSSYSLDTNSELLKSLTIYFP
jgi:hypothetical protein